ncbi:MAG: hypothetical protein QW117_02445 [Candidatus Pacearchaeota archaeon]
MIKEKYERKIEEERDFDYEDLKNYPLLPKEKGELEIILNKNEHDAMRQMEGGKKNGK